ncbi:hypothetical protein [Aquipuribacter hungaricus]|uniref:Secreted protein n=1 Tax=Aquipuribacter hungaricus TaxID=545624 RepID=A0ABV7WBI3_9MICO
MRRDARQHLLSAAAAALLLAGCGTASTAADGAGAAASGGARTPDGADAPGTAEPSADGASSSPPLREGQGRLAEEPAFVDELDEASDAWPDPDAFTGDGYRLAAGETVDVPYSAPGSALGSLLVVAVTMPETGAVTAVCDLGPALSVSLELRAEGGWLVEQTTDGTPVELDSGTLDPGQRGEPGEATALRLLCSDSPDGLAVGVSLHGAGLSFVTGATGAVPAGGPTWRVSSTGDVGSVLDSVDVYLVEA